MTMHPGKLRPDWDMIVTQYRTLRQLERFRVSLLLEGKDTRSARMAITKRRDQLLKLAGRPRQRRFGK